MKKQTVEIREEKIRRQEGWASVRRYLPIRAPVCVPLFHFLFSLFALLGPALCAGATTVTGTIQLPDGTPVNGTLEFTLSQRAQTTTPPILYVPEKTTCAISNGAITACSVQGNDTLSPAGTFYRVRILDANNRPLGPTVNYTLSGASVDLGSLPVTATDTLVPPDGAVVGNLNVTGNLTVGGSADFGADPQDYSHLHLLGLTADPATVTNGSVFHRSDLDRLRLRVQGLQLFDGTQYVDINSSSPNTIDIGGDLKVTGGTELGQFADLKCSSAPNPPDGSATRMYCLTADRKLYFKDNGGVEFGPLATLNTPQSWSAAQTFDTIQVGSWNNVFIVDGVKYTTIQAAVLAADAAGGGTVFVPAGSYTVSADPFDGRTNPITLILASGVRIDTSVTIGPPAGSRIIGQGYGSQINMTTIPPFRILQADADNIEFTGLRLTTTDTVGSWALARGRGAIHVAPVLGIKHTWIHHNFIDNVAMVGVTVDQDAAQNSVHDNIIINPREHCIYLAKSTENVVHDNICIDAGVGGDPPLGKQGIKCAACTRSLIHHNYVDNPGEIGISLEGSDTQFSVDGTVVDGNTVRIFSGASGMAMRIASTATGQATIQNNFITDNNVKSEAGGLYIQGGAGGHIVRGNKIRITNTGANAAGIRTRSTNADSITGNTVIADATNVPYGIMTDTGTGHVITNNWVLNGTGNFVTGIRTLGSTSSSVLWNTVQATTRYSLAPDTIIGSHEHATRFTTDLNLDGGELTIGAGGIAANGAGYKHKRVSTGSIPAGESAAVSLTWTTAFADTNYTVVGCVVEDATAATLALRLHHVESKTAAGLVARLVNDDGDAAHSGSLHCTAVHD